MRRAHGNLCQQPTDKVAMVNKGGYLFSSIALLMFTAVAVHDSTEPPVLFHHVTMIHRQGGNIRLGQTQI